MLKLCHWLHPSSGFVWLFCQSLYNGSTFFASNLTSSSHSAAMLDRSSSTEIRKRLLCDVPNTFVTHPGLIYDVIGTVWYTHNGSAHGRVFAFLKPRFLASRILNEWKNARSLLFLLLLLLTTATTTTTAAAAAAAAPTTTTTTTTTFWSLEPRVVFRLVLFIVGRRTIASFF